MILYNIEESGSVFRIVKLEDGVFTDVEGTFSSRELAEKKIKLLFKEGKKGE